ncbi:hypothetical protein FoTM2_016312 [Fusarium oxysporum f. sp. vasinfectum]|nr:hypothetical protein FoTM2_016312 [Fusarium oxysporum f. sp. vasinfectum]
MSSLSIFMGVLSLSTFTLAAGNTPGLPLVINTWGGDFTAATDAAFTALGKKASALDAVEIGGTTCENKQCDGSVGFGGSPDENCETTLDAMIMDGGSMNSGAVAALRRVKSAISVARHVLDHTTHSLIVGDQATEFAIQNGFKTTSLSTKNSDKQCKDWKAKKCQPNYRINVSPNPASTCGPYKPLVTLTTSTMKTNKQTGHDTLSLIAIHKDGSMAAGTTTNGASHKIPGRVGDGPIGMRNGLSPKEAAEDAVLRMVRKYGDLKSGIVVVDRYGNHGAACSGWNFQYSYRGGKMTKTKVVTVKPVQEV